jgi:hypothetical protein
MKLVAPKIIELDNGTSLDLTEPSEEADKWNRFFGKVLAPGIPFNQVKIVLDDKTKIIEHMCSQDYYIYCLTSKFEESVMQGPDYGACIEVIEPHGFFKAISRSIYQLARFQSLLEVQYGNKTTSYLDPHKLHPAITKDHRFEKLHPHEWRAFWSPIGKAPISPLIIDVPKAIPFCRVYAP